MPGLLFRGITAWFLNKHTRRRSCIGLDVIGWWECGRCGLERRVNIKGRTDARPPASRRRAEAEVVHRFLQLLVLLLERIDALLQEFDLLVIRLQLLAQERLGGRRGRGLLLLGRVS